MPTPNETLLWESVPTKHYDIIKKLIIENPTEDLVNSANSNGISLLARLFSVKPIPLDLIQFIADHPKFNLNYQNPKTQKTNTEVIISIAQPEVFAIFSTNPGIIHNNGIPSYLFANKCLLGATKSFEIQSKKDPKSVNTKCGAERVEIFKNTLSKLRDMTIHHAIATDDPNLLDQLEQAGANLDKKLSDGSYLVRLLNKSKSNPNLKAWYPEHTKKSLAANPAAFFKQMKELENELATLKSNHAKKQADRMSKIADKRIESFDRMTAAFN